MRRLNRRGPRSRRLRPVPVVCAYGMAGLLGLGMVLGLAKLATTPEAIPARSDQVAVLALPPELPAPLVELPAATDAEPAVAPDTDVEIAELPPTLSGRVRLPQPTWSMRISPPPYEEHLPPPVAAIEPAAPPVETRPAETREVARVDAPVVVSPMLAKPERSPYVASGQIPLVTIIIDDMGYSPRALARLAALPGPVTLSFLPYADATQAMLAAAGQGEFDIFLHLPMEPLGDADPGINALLANLDETQLRKRVRQALAAVPGAIGVNNHMGSRLTALPETMRWVMDELRQQPLLFVDSRTNPDSVAEATAAMLGVPTTGRDVFIDHVPEPEAIARQLALIERIARRGGSVVAIGHPYDVTLRALERWLPEIERRGFRLASVADVIAYRHCGDAALDPWTCRPELQLVGTGAIALQPGPLTPGKAVP
ncbi:MAG: divergent polysaccharide deacetylase family protein [Geminicoccaceae bacterium]